MLVTVYHHNHPFLEHLQQVVVEQHNTLVVVHKTLVVVHKTLVVAEHIATVKHTATVVVVDALALH